MTEMKMESRRSNLRALPDIPALCERADCDEAAEFVKRYDLIGAPEPAFACRRHRRAHSTRGLVVQTLVEYVDSVVK
jgi:hypothetical protein